MCNAEVAVYSTALASDPRNPDPVKRKLPMFDDVPTGNKPAPETSKETLLFDTL